MFFLQQIFEYNALEQKTSFEIEIMDVKLYNIWESNYLWCLYVDDYADDE